MSFADYVARVFGKKPVWLYEITIAATSYHYTSRGAAISTPANVPSTDFPSGQTWAPRAIKRGSVLFTVKAAKSNTWISLPTSDAVAAAAIAGADVSTATVRIWQGYIGDPDNEFRLIFTGRVVSMEPGLITTQLNCETSITESRRSSVAQVVQRPCRHAHYFTNADGGGCRLNLADWQQTVTATAATGRVLTVPAAANENDAHYLAGILTYDGNEYMIERHEGEILTIETEVPGLADEIALADPPGASVQIAPGCNLTAENCNAFGNLVNFGGFNDMTDSPFDGRSII